MPKFRKKPVVIEAVQFDGENGLDIISTFGSTMTFEKVEKKIQIPTLEGTMTAEPGDWIIKGVKGELYPCKPDIFNATYEEVTMPDKNRTVADPQDEPGKHTEEPRDRNQTSPTAQPEPDVATPPEAPAQSNVAGDPDVDTSDDAEHNPPENHPSASA